jgi:flagellin
MISPVNNNLTGLVFESHNDKIELDQSLAKLSSGNKLIRAGDDTGAFSQASKLGSKNKRDLVSLQNLQNLVSYSQTQDGALEQVGKILNRLNEITVRALDVTATDADRENYNKEFIELADQLEQIETNDFNGKKLFGAGAFSDDKKEFIESLKNNWLKAAEDLIIQEYGWAPKPADSWDLIVNENDTGSYAAFVKSSWYTSGPDFGKADVSEMQFDLPDFATPHTQPTSTADGVVAHEMVHLMQAQNSYFGDLTGDGTSSANWFKEGLAEFIRGADSRVFSILGNNPSDGDIDNLLSAIGTGNESWSSSEQYASGFLAARFLDYEIKQIGQAGIKHMTTWMKTEFDADSGSSVSGINTYISTFLNGRYSTDDNNGFISAFKGTDGRNYIKDVGKYDYTNNVQNLANTDTGSVRGSDAGGAGGTLNAQAVIADATGSPQGSYIEETEESSLAASIDGTGATYDLKTVNSITISDTSTYNLKSIANARSTLTELITWTENLATERANVGANLSRLEKEIQNLNGKITTGEMAVGRIQDTDVARESTIFASSQVRMQASIAILAQAKDLNVGIRDLIRGIMIGQS